MGFVLMDYFYVGLLFIFCLILSVTGRKKAALKSSKTFTSKKESHTTWYDMMVSKSQQNFYFWVNHLCNFLISIFSI